MRKIILFILFLLGKAFYVEAQNTDWVKSFGGPNSDKGISIDTDSSGFVYISGFFNNQANFDAVYVACSPLSTWSNNKEFYLAKLDSFGTVSWAIRGGNGSGGCCDDRALGMFVTPDGYSFLTGTTWSSFDIGGCTLSGGNSHDGSILTKIDPNGNCVWLKTFGADEGAGSGANCPYPIYDADDHAYDVVVDEDDFVYVAGFYSGLSADFDAFTITNPTWGADCQPKGYVGKLDPNGNWLWVHNYDGIKDQRGSRDSRIAIDNFSNVYVTGGFQNTGNYGPLSLTSQGEWDAFLFKMDKDGNWLWARNVGSNKTDRANGIAIDNHDNIYISGEYRNPMVFSGANASNGTDTLSHAKKRDVFVAKITTNGDWVWAKRARSKGTDKAYQMSVDDNMQVFLSGMCGDSMKFNNSIDLSVGDTTSNAFVAQLDGSGIGDWVWAKLGGGPTDDDRMGDICEDGGSNVYAIGFFEETANFDGYSFTSTGTDNKKDIIVWKLKKDLTVNLTPSNRIYVEVQPPGSGTVNMTGTGTIITSSTNVSNFPCYQSLSDSVVQDFEAIATAGYSFANWDWKIHNPLPNNTSAVTTVLTYTTDTLIVNFNAIVTDSVVYIVQPAGAGTINLDGTNVNVFPHTEYHIQGDTSSIQATANLGYTFADWDFQNNTPTPNTTSSNIDVTWTSNDTVFINFDTIPTYEVTYVTNLPGAGSIDVNSVAIPGFPFTMLYAHGSAATLSVNVNPGFFFVDWDFQSNTPLPNNLSTNISTTWLSDDTVMVNFAVIPNYTITFLTNPVGAGNLDIDGVNQAAFPFSPSYQSGTNVIVGANNNPNFTFKEWSTNQSTLNPSNQATIVDFNVIGNDTVIANYDEVDTLWVITRPAGTAQLEVGSDVITTSPFMGIYQIGDLLPINISPYNSNIFNQWDLSPATLPDYSQISSFIFNGQDTLFASLNNILAIQDIGEDFNSVNLFPNLIQEDFVLEMEAAQNLEVEVGVFSLSGKALGIVHQGTLYSGQIFRESFKLDVAAGLYFIQVRSNETLVNFKVVKQ